MRESAEALPRHGRRLRVFLLGLGLLALRLAALAFLEGTVPGASPGESRRDFLKLAPAALGVVALSGPAPVGAWDPSEGGTFECLGENFFTEELLGAGAHGQVYGNDDNPEFVVKVSYNNTAQIIRDECAILQQLEQNYVPFALRCKGVCQTPAEDRVAALLTPRIEEGRQLTADFLATAQLSPRSIIITAMAQFLVACLSANIAVVDLQALVTIKGDVAFYDFTGAGDINGPGGDVRVKNFIAEWCALIPPKAHIEAAVRIEEEIQLSRLNKRRIPFAAGEALAELPLFGANEELLVRVGQNARAAVMR